MKFATADDMQLEMQQLNLPSSPNELKVFLQNVTLKYCYASRISVRRGSAFGANLRIEPGAVSWGKVR